MQLLHGSRLLRGAACTARLTKLHSPHLRLHTTQRRWRTSLDFNALDTKWRQKWKTELPPPASETKPRYVLPMFPYPSGTLHLGHLRVYTIADVVARYRKLNGDDVVLPMGWDAFGLPAENAALERGIPPGEWTTSNIARMKEQLEVMNGSWDWDRELTTCDPNFYKHTQKLFLMLHERGLAYQAEAEVNYDPIDKTVLANEQVDANGCSWRSGAKVEKRKLKQWFFKISEFQEALLNGLHELEKDGAWPTMVVSQQRNWLGKSTGATVKFPVMALGHSVGTAIEVFTTRPDTLFGVQYIAMAATHPTVRQLAKADPELQAFLDTLPGLPADSKVGYLLPGLRAVNPLAYHPETPDATKASLPVYVASYVLGDYGEGAVMGVPGHDVRDHAFWTKHHADEPVRVVLAASEDESTTVMKNEPYIGEGTLTEHSGPYEGKSSTVAGEMIIKMLEHAGLATPVEKWRLRDWLISRQRYWGTPIPIVHCDSCGAVPVPDEDLPVKLPEVEWAGGKPGNALETSPEFVETTCPKCKGPAKRDTDTMDTFVDSSWYYARFADPQNAKELLSAEAAQALPVDVYLGGIEHAILHLLYARFIYKFLASTNVLPQYSEDQVAAAEPFQRLITQGMVQGRTYSDPDTGKFLKPDEVDLSDPSKPTVVATGREANMTFEKMSKSKYNGVDPTEFIGKYGADPTRAHIIFQAPVADLLNWDEEKISGVTRWLKRLHDQVSEIGEASTDQSVKDVLSERQSHLATMDKEELAQWDADSTVWREVQKTIKSVTGTYDEIYYINTVVSDLMSLTNVMAGHKNASPVVRQQAAVELTRMLAPIAPAFAEECWSILCPGAGSVFTSRFPETDGSEELVQPREQTWTVQVNGKQRGVVEIAPPPDTLSDEELGPWMTEAILKTDLGRRLRGEDGNNNNNNKSQPVDLRAAKRVIPLRHARRVAYVV